MSSHKVRVSSVRNGKPFLGEIVIPSINYPIQSGSVVMLEEEDFLKSDVQGCLKSGFLVEEPLNEDIIIPDEDFDDDEDMIDIPLETIQTTPTKKKGRVVFRNKNAQGQDINEVVKQINAKEAQLAGETEIDPRDFDDTSTTPLVWDGSNQQALTAQEGRKKVMNDLSTFEMDVQSGDIDLDTAPVAAPKKMVKKASKKRKKAKKTLPVPDLGDIDLVFDDESDDIGFVDQEQTAAKIAAHPILSKKKKKTKKFKKTRKVKKAKKAEMNEEIE